MAKYNTTVTKKDGTKASGYIEDGKSYYNDGSSIQSGDSVTDASGRTWTKGNDTPTQSMSDYLASYGVSSSGSSNRTPLRSSKELAELFDINYDIDDITNLYNDATNAKYKLLSNERQQAENNFYSQTANSNASLLDTLRKATSSAIATGASRGIASAEQLGLAMEQQQANVEQATVLAQDRAKMADEIAAEKAQNIIDAFDYSTKLKQGLATNSANLYSADTQFDVGEMDKYAQLANVMALLKQIEAESVTNANAQTLEEKLRTAEMANNKDIAQINANTSLAVARENSKNYSGGNYNQYTIEDYNKYASAQYELAYNQGDLNNAAKWYVENGWADDIATAKKELLKDTKFTSNMNGSGITTNDSNPVSSFVSNLFGTNNNSRTSAISNPVNMIGNALINEIGNKTGKSTPLSMVPNYNTPLNDFEKSLLNYYKNTGLNDSDAMTKVKEYRTKSVKEQSEIIKKVNTK